MLHNQNILKTYRKSSFSNQINHSVDSFEENDNSSSSDTLSSDLISSSSANSSTSSDSTSSDNSSEFNEVEKVIEEYFIRKLGKSCISKSYNLNTPRGFYCIYHNKNRSTSFEKSLQISNLEFQNLFIKEKVNSSSEIGIQVSSSDLKKFYALIRKKRNILRSNSLDILLCTGIWTIHKNLKLYLNKSVNDLNLCTLFEYSFPTISRGPKTIRHTVEYKSDAFIGIKNKFNEYFFYIKNSKLAISINNISPFKAIILLDKKTSKICLYNEKANLLFKLDNKNYLSFENFFVKKLQYANLVDYHLNNNGKICYLPSKLVMVKDSFNFKFVVSLRFQKVNTNCSFQYDIDPIILIIEPLIISDSVSLINNGQIIGFDNDFINMFRLHKLKFNNIFNKNISDLWSSSHRLFDKKNNTKEIKHNLINFTKQDIPFYFLSFCSSVSIYEVEMYSKIYNLKTTNISEIKNDFYINFMWFYSNISYVLIISLNGKVIDCDPFFNYLTGYSTIELLNIDINKIIKYNSCEFYPYLISQNTDDNYKICIIHLNGSEINATVWINKLETNCFYSLWFVTNSRDFKSPSPIHLACQMKEDHAYNTLSDLYIEMNKERTNIFNLENITNSKNNKNIVLLTKRKSHSLPEYNHLKKLTSSRCSIQTSIDIKDTSCDNSYNFEEVSQNKDIDIFHNNYDMLNIIGKGAFGFVRLALSILDNKEFVVKFIKKSKLTTEHMVKVQIEEVNKSERRLNLINGYETASEDKILKTQFIDKEDIFIFIPREIWMLCQLNHDNIVSLHDWYEGLDHYQMVMPKHGVGMDLFEFIDRSPILDEILVSYIFRQLANAVDYLHGLMISHRDIKDENIILDNVFKIKLIDFGAAIKVEPDQKFKTFCGTMEFCSPEILLGQEYNSFHADIWSMGITLYTIMFGENPFYDFEETINAVIKPPKSISTDLFQLLSMLLEPNPINRITAASLSNHSWLQQNVDITKYSFEEIVPNSTFCGNMASDFRKYSIDSNCDITKNKSNHVSRKMQI